MSRYEDEPMLHLYPQETWHGNAAIVGNTRGLRDLRDAIDRVLNPALPEEEKVDHLGMRTAEMYAVPGDGETHSLNVHHLPGDHDNWNRLTLPYVEYSDKKNRGYGDPEYQILPPEWGRGLARRLDIVSLPAVPPSEIPDNIWETFLKFHDLSDEEKMEFKKEVEEWKEMNTRGGSS